MICHELVLLLQIRLILRKLPIPYFIRVEWIWQIWSHFNIWLNQNSCHDTVLTWILNYTLSGKKEQVLENLLDIIRRMVRSFSLFHNLDLKQIWSRDVEKEMNKKVWKMLYDAIWQIIGPPSLSWPRTTSSQLFTQLSLNLLQSFF